MENLEVIGSLNFYKISYQTQSVKKLSTQLSANEFLRP